MLELFLDSWMQCLCAASCCHTEVGKFGTIVSVQRIKLELTDHIC